MALPGSWLMLDDVNLVTKAGASASFNNATFESWTDTVVSTIADWYTVNLTMKKTSNAYSGNSAVELEVKEITHDDGKKEKIGAIVANYDFHNSSGGGTHFTATPIKLEGYWNYSPAINDTGWVSIEFFKNGKSVGVSGYKIASTTNGYQKFSLDLSVTEKPDTFKVSLYAGDSIGTKMLVDDLNLISDATVGVEQQVSSTGNVFPNPTTDLLHVGNAHSYSVSNVIGVLLGQGRVKASVISLAGFRKGVYVLTLRNSDGESIHTQKIVKK